MKGLLVATPDVSEAMWVGPRSSSPPPESLTLCVATTRLLHLPTWQ